MWLFQYIQANVKDLRVVRPFTDRRLILLHILALQKLHLIGPLVVSSKIGNYILRMCIILLGEKNLKRPP